MNNKIRILAIIVFSLLTIAGLFAQQTRPLLFTHSFLFVDITHEGSTKTSVMTMFDCNYLQLDNKTVYLFNIMHK